MKQLMLAVLLAFSVGLAQQTQPGANDAALRQAQAALEANQLADAVRGFEAVIAKEYSNYSAHFGLGLALYRQADLRGAAFEFTQLTVLDPERFEGWFNLGVVRDRQGQAADAATAFAKALEVGEKAGLAAADLKPAFLGQAKALRIQGKHDEAATVLRRGLTKAPADADLTSLLADSLVKGGKPLEALPFLYQILGADPANVTAISQVADIFIAQGLNPRALREIDRGLETVKDGSGRAQLLLKKSGLLEGRDQVAALQEAARLDPKLWAAHYNLGLARLRANDNTGALGSFQSAYAQNPDEPKVQLGLATIYDRLNQPAESARFAAMAAKSAQGNDRVDALFLQGKAAYTQRRYADAAEALSQATTLKADRGDAWLLLGLSQFAQRNYPASIASLEKAQALAPNSQTASNLGAALLASSRFSDAERVLTQAVSLDEKNSLAWFNLGIALRSLQRSAEARRAFQRSADLGYAPAREQLR